MVGRAGPNGEDLDEGRWWVEGDRWHREWRRWAYGEPASFYVRVTGGELQLFNERRQLVDALRLATVGRAR